MKVIANALRAGLPPHCRSCLNAAGGVQGSGHQVKTLQRGLLGREVPAGPNRPPVAGMSDSTAFVEQMTRRIPTKSSRNGTNSLQAFSQSRMIAGYCPPHFLAI